MTSAKSFDDTFADGFGPSAVEVRAAIDQADIRALVTALCTGAFQNDFGDNGFACPRCGRWSAEVLDACRWLCSFCETHSTVWELQRRVREDVYAAMRLTTGSS